MQLDFDRHRAHHNSLEVAHAAIREQAPGRAREILGVLHEYAHDDPEVHSKIHRLLFHMARESGDFRAALGEVLPMAFAGTVARVERLAPSFDYTVAVEATREVVYAVMTDFDDYARWNPWLTHAQGDARVGASVAARVRMGARTMEVGHRVLVAVPGEFFAWCDTGWFTPLAQGRRLRSLVWDGARTIVNTRLVVTGPLAPLAWALHGSDMCAGLIAESQALGSQCEAVYASGRVLDPRRASA